MIVIRDIKAKAKKFLGVKKIVVSQIRGAKGRANRYHVKVYLDDIESIVKVAKNKETSDDLSQATYKVLVAASGDHSFTLPEPEFLSFER